MHWLAIIGGALAVAAAIGIAGALYSLTLKAANDRWHLVDERHLPFWVAGSALALILLSLTLV